LEGLHIFSEFYYTKRNWYEFFSGRFSSTYNGDIDLIICDHRLIAKLTPKVPRPISCQKPLKTAMFVALAQENKKNIILTIQP